ncbi:MAG: RidA family protein, partial [Caldilineaceae bacterium]
MQPTRINPAELFDSRPYGFSQMVVTPPEARMIHMSGQVAWNAQEEIVGKDDLYAQVVQSLRNIETALRHVDATLDNVVALRMYIKQSHMHV